MKINFIYRIIFCSVFTLVSFFKVNGQVHSDQNGLKSSVIKDLTANNTQALRYEVASVGFNSYHWQPGGIIIVELFQSSFTTGYQKYIIDNGFGTGINSGQTKIRLVESSGLEQLAKVSLGTVYDLSSSHGGFVNKAYPIYIDVKYYANYKAKITYQQERVESVDYMNQIKVNTAPVPITIDDFSVTVLSDNPLTSTSNLMVTGEGTHFISQGKLGIGTTAPNYPLDVAKYMSVGAQGGLDIALLGGGTGVGSILKLYYADGRENTRLMGNNDSWLNAYSGNLGIGLVNPTEKLTVNGKIKALEIRVDAHDMPDYVFEEGYEVGTLEELESYIKKNKHLPEIPSAIEAEKNGLELGEMNKLLLKKIEELTLYIIEEHKLNEKRGNLLDAQRLKITELEKTLKSFKK